METGTNAVYLAPQWPNIHNAIHLAGGEPRPVPLGFDGDWRLDLDRLFASLRRAHARHRAVDALQPDRLDGAAARNSRRCSFSRRTGIWIVSDEVYSRLYLRRAAAPSILQVAEDGDRVLSVNSFSKAWAMTGWRVGWLTHPSASPTSSRAMTQFVNSGTSGPLQAGALAALRDGEPLVGEVKARIKTGLDLAYTTLCQAEFRHSAQEACRRHVCVLFAARRGRRATRLLGDPGKGASGPGARLSVRDFVDRIPADVRLPRRGAARDRHGAYGLRAGLGSRTRGARRVRSAGDPDGEGPCEGMPMIENRRRLLILGTAVALAASPFAAHAADTLNVGAYPTNPPFEYKNADGKFEGFEVDIVNEAAKRAGMTTDIADYGFQALFSGIASKRIDVAISSITITPERLKTVSFSQPYYDSDMGIAAAAAGAVQSEADLKGKTVGVLSGSTGETWAKAHHDAGGFGDIKGYNTQQEMLLDLSNGRLDAVVSDVPGLEYSFTKMKGLAVKTRIKTGEQYGLLMAKDSPLLGRLSDALTAMKKDGTLAALHKKWFGSDAPANSATVTVLPIPKG